MHYLNFLIIFLGIGGFSLALYIYKSKKVGKNIVCPVGYHCNEVIYSNYSRFLGIPVEIMGMVYYFVLVFSYSIFLFFPGFALSQIVFGMLALSASALLFSLYLTFIQIFSLRQLCTWCLISGGISASIFVISLLASESAFVTLLFYNYYLIVVLHLIGAALGLGAATITDIFFFKFIKDFRISDYEFDVIRILSQLIWFALGIIVLTGFGLYLSDPLTYNQSPKFLVKMIIVAIIIINGSVLNLLIAPRLLAISFGKVHDHELGELRSIRRLAFALGAISITSWYSAFILGALHNINNTFLQILSIYILILVFAITISQVIERRLGK